MKIRLDQYLCQNGLAQSRERAKALIMAGIVYVGEEKSDKPGNMVDENAHVEVRGHDIRYVSRGGLKLERRCRYFRSPRRERFAWISARPQAVSPTACCKTEL